MMGTYFKHKGSMGASTAPGGYGSPSEFGDLFKKPFKPTSPGERRARDHLMDQPFKPSRERPRVPRFPNIKGSGPLGPLRAPSKFLRMHPAFRALDLLELGWQYWQPERHQVDLSPWGYSLACKIPSTGTYDAWSSSRFQICPPTCCTPGAIDPGGSSSHDMSKVKLTYSTGTPKRYFLRTIYFGYWNLAATRMTRHEMWQRPNNDESPQGDIPYSPQPYQPPVVGPELPSRPEKTKPETTTSPRIRPERELKPYERPAITTTITGTKKSPPSGGGHILKPPPPGVKEKKGNINLTRKFYAAIAKIYDAATEADEIVDILADNLKGKPCKNTKGMAEKANCVARNIEDLDLEGALKDLAANYVEDKVFGNLYKYGKKSPYGYGLSDGIGSLGNIGNVKLL